MTYRNNFVAAIKCWLAENEQPTLRQARLNAPGSHHALSHYGHITGNQALVAKSKVFPNHPARYFPLFNNVPCFSTTVASTRVLRGFVAS